jgi:N-acetylmuramoyl-L-alanine amidase
MILQGKAKAPVKEAILHCAAIESGQFNFMTPLQVFTTINRWHIERGFRSFGYHGLFMPNGAYFSGRPFDQLGAHVAGHNSGTLGFLLIESKKIDRIGDFSDWFTDQQRRALVHKLLSIPGLERVSGHNDYADKLCPGFKVKTLDWV